MFLYNLSIYAFQLGLKLASPFNPKAKLWVRGRKNWKDNLKNKVEALQLENAIWFHCASLGEFEQGRPVLERLKNNNPHQKIVLTFFSPSGFENKKNYPLADIVLYLPADTFDNANYFIKTLNPTIAVFVKYEFWLNYLFALKSRQIPTFLISTVIKKHQSFFKWYGDNFRKALATYKTIYTQDLKSLKFLEILNIKTGQLAGDTRFDRVLQIGESPKKKPEIEEFSKDSFVIIAGSSWQKDEEILIESYLTLKTKYPYVKLIIVPHEIDVSNIERLKNLLAQKQIAYHLYSDDLTSYSHSVLVINAIGLLSSVYQYGSIAFIGGGFNNGIHNILEPMVFGLPVLFGPNYKKFNEAFDVIKLKAGFVILNSEDLNKQFINFLENQNELNQTSSLARSYIQDHSGATDKIAKGIQLVLNGQKIKEAH